MNKNPPTIHLLLAGFPDPEFSQLHEGLVSQGFSIQAREEEIKSGTNSGYPDCIIINTSPDYDGYQNVKVLQNRYPLAAIIGCGTEQGHRIKDSDLPDLLDGNCLVDLSSISWTENLAIVVQQGIRIQKIKQKKLNEEDRTYERIFEKSPIPIAISDIDTGIFFEVNQAFLTTYGYERNEVIGKSSLDLHILDPETREKLIQGYDKPGIPEKRELEIHTKDGRRIVGLFKIQKILWRGRDVLLHTMDDITYLKEIEASLSAKNLCIQKIFASVSEGIIVYDTHLNYRVWNRFMEHLSGINEEDIRGKHSLYFHPIIEGDDLYSLAKKALVGITSTSEDVWYQVPSTGKSGWLSIIYTPFRETDGTIIGVIASVRDISQRKKAEDEIRSHKGLLRSIIDTIPVSIICFDENGKILLANKEFGIIFGVTPEIIEGHSYEDFGIESRFETHVPLIKKAFAGREVPFNEETTFTAGSSKRFLRGRYSPLRGTDGVITGVVAVIIDITDLKIAHNSIELINAKLHLLSSITRHDILNSLTGVLGYLTYAEEELNPDMLHTFIHKAYQTALLIQEQIEFTRDYQDLGVKEPIWQNARQVFISALSNLKTGDVKIDLSIDDLSIYADPLLERVIYNLVDNALRYGEKITRISSEWYIEGPNAIWVIHDDGVGIPEQMKEKIFRKGVGKNTGLGLFLTREILDITGLTIAERGEEGKGSRFEITIPPWAFEKCSPDR